MFAKNLKYKFLEWFYYVYAFKMQYLFTLTVQVPLLLLGFYLSPWFYLISLFWFILQILDFKSRLSEFRRIRLNSKYKDKWLKQQCHAPCRRDATMAALRNIRYGRQFYYNMGYRWYHLIPDNFFVRIFSLSYWKAALFK